MAQFSIPKGPAMQTLNIDYFKGVDLYNAAANVEPYRSPEAPNMVRDEVGKVRKRMGYRTEHTFPARINGVWELDGVQVVHAGTCLYRTTGAAEQAEGGSSVPAGYTLLREGLADSRSKGVQFGGKLYLLDGKQYLVFDGSTVQPVSEAATVPTIIISRDPDGGGTPYQPLNLIGTKWTEQFLGKDSVKVYQLTAQDLDETPVTAWILQKDGTWTEKKEGTDFTVDRKLGKVTFSAAPGASPVTGMDNVKITASKEREGYAGRIDHCDIAAVYGVGGSPDRLFLSGDPDRPNLDYYSAFNDPAMFGDTWYSQLGQDDARVMGYTVIGDCLAAHKSAGADGRNIILRRGALDGKGEAVFQIVNTLQGEGAVSKHAFARLGSEPLFLTKLGVYAITSEELTGEKYSQQRSLYLSSAIQGETELSDAAAFTWRDFYLLAGKERLYLLDGLQKQYEKNAPYSNFQYEGYYWENIWARVLWEKDGGAVVRDQRRAAVPLPRQRGRPGELQRRWEGHRRLLGHTGPVGKALLEEQDLSVSVGAAGRSGGDGGEDLRAEEGAVEPGL